MKTITTRLQDELLNKQGLTPYAVAKRLKVSVGNVDVWLVGRLKNKKRVFSTPNPESIVNICREFNLDLVYIMTGVNAGKSYPMVTVTPKEEKKIESKPVATSDIKDKLLAMYEKEIAVLTSDLTACREQVQQYKQKRV